MLSPDEEGLSVDASELELDAAWNDDVGSGVDVDVPAPVRTLVVRDWSLDAVDVGGGEEDEASLDAFSDVPLAVCVVGAGVAFGEVASEVAGPVAESEPEAFCLRTSLSPE